MSQPNAFPRRVDICWPTAFFAQFEPGQIDISMTIYSFVNGDPVYIQRDTIHRLETRVSVHEICNQVIACDDGNTWRVMAVGIPRTLPLVGSNLFADILPTKIFRVSRGAQIDEIKVQMDFNAQINV